MNGLIAKRACAGGVCSFLLMLCLAHSWPAAAKQYETRLEYSTEGVFQSHHLNMGGLEVRFRAEPAFGRDVIRGALAATDDEDMDYVGFACDIDTDYVWVDLDGDLDLTDGPGGVYAGVTSDAGGAEAVFSRNGMALRYRFQVSAYDVFNVYCYVRSGWSGSLDIDGEQYHLKVVDNLDGRLDGSDELYFSTEEAEAFGRLGAASMGLVPLPAHLVLGARNFDLSFDFVAEGDSGAVTVTAVETEEGLGTLDMGTRRVSQAVLEGDRCILIEHPGAEVRVPAGAYSVSSIRLGDAFVTSGIQGRPYPLSVAKGKRVDFGFGAPLVQHVDAVRQGRHLVLSYRLEGAGGMAYSKTDGSRRNPPRFSVYNGGREVKSAVFEFG